MSEPIERATCPNGHMDVVADDLPGGGYVARCAHPGCDSEPMTILPACQACGERGTMHKTACPRYQRIVVDAYTAGATQATISRAAGFDASVIRRMLAREGLGGKHVRDAQKVGSTPKMRAALLHLQRIRKWREATR